MVMLTGSCLKAKKSGLKPSNNMIITEENLTYHLVRRPELKDSQIKRMYDLMAENYDYVHYDIFYKDLSKKDFVGIIRTSDGNIQGFTTYAVDPHDIKIEDSHIIFSGDTIINPKFWGTQILMKAWCNFFRYINEF